MKKLNRILLYLTISSVVFGFSSCDDFLDLNPISEATTGNAYSSASDAEAALIGAYDSFQQEYYIWDNIVFNDVISDNYYAGGDNPEIFAIDNINISPTNSRLFNNWSQLYTGIARANVVLQKVPDIKDPKLDVGNRREKILGEAAFLRAYHYYNLANMWGGVPLIIQPVESLDPAETNQPKSSAIEVYSQIIADLNFAIARLPYTYGDDAGVNKARATKGAAYALMAKTYAQKDDRDYQKVLAYCDSVITSPANYRLLDDFTHLFDGNHYNNAESIIEVQFTGGTEANFGPQMVLPPSVSGDTWRKFVTPSKDLVAAFDNEGDNVRKNASILFEEAPWSDEFWSLEVGGQVPFAYKWKSANGWASTNRQYLLRLADIILLKAEALNELNRPADAKVEVDKVRDRVGLPPTTASGQAEMRMAVLLERRLELCQEAERWDDLRRLGLAVEVMNSLIEIDLRDNQPVDYDMQPYKLLLPISQQELNRNPQLKQNDGYK